MNAGLLVDMPHLHQSGADGIGLFRTELQFMVASKFPKMQEQRAAYARVLDEAQGSALFSALLTLAATRFCLI